jgi:hypothetical protein
MEPREKQLTMGLAGALACALLVIAFLLGRVTAPRTEPARLAPSVQTAGASGRPIATTTPEQTAASAFTTPEAAPMVTADPRPPRSEPVLSFPTAPEIAPQNSPPKHTKASSERDLIAAYFGQVDRLEDFGAGDPQAFASSLMDSVSTGDFTKFDELLTRSRTQRDRLRAVTPPRSCAEHHRIALALSGDSVAMMEKLRAALIKGDTMALLAMAAEARTLEAQANKLKAMGETIKKQLGAT